MTLRQRLGADVQRIHEQLDELLDTENAVIILADGRRSIHYALGFGLSACQHELLAAQVDRAIRAATRVESAAGSRAVGRRQRSSTAA